MAEIAMATQAVISTMRKFGVAPFASKFDALSSTLAVGSIFTARYSWSCLLIGADGSSAELAEITTPVAAFSFEEPYIAAYVTLTVTDENGQSSTVQQRIDIQSFDSLLAKTTQYVDYVGGNDTTGTGTELLPWKTLYKAINVMLAGTTADTACNWRILLKKGVTHVVANATVHNAITKRLGPVRISSYGSGAKPIIDDQWPTSNTNGTISITATRVSDWTFSDLRFKGSYDTVAGNVEDTRYAFRALVDIDQANSSYQRLDLLFLRCDIDHYGQGLLVQVDAPQYQATAQSKGGNVCVIDCAINDIAGTNAFGHWIDSAFIRTQMIGCDGSHVLRMEMAKRVVLWDCVLLDPSKRSGTGRLALKLHALGVGEPSGTNFGCSEHVYITGGRARGSTTVFGIQPQSSGHAQELRYIIVDGVSLEADVSGLGPNATSYCINFVGHDMMVRNCIMENGPDGHAIGLQDYPTVVGLPRTTNIYVYHNTARAQQGAADGTGFLRPVDLLTTAKIYAYNNVAYADAGDLSFISTYYPGGGTFNHLSIFDGGNVVTPVDAQYLRDSGANKTFAQWKAIAPLQHGVNSVNDLDPVFPDTDPNSPDISSTSELIAVPNVPAVPEARYDINDLQRVGVVVVGAAQSPPVAAPIG